uniref:Clade I nitrous oxide reductase n=1 Tax=Anisakis simplex TaxID=6269 RepID=A0A0M3JJH6_ANISI
LDASDELEDDVFAPTELPDSFSSTSTARPISSFNTRIVEPQTAPLQPKQVSIICAMRLRSLEIAPF